MRACSYLELVYHRHLRIACCTVSVLVVSTPLLICFVQEEYGIGPAQVDALFHFAKFQFECGSYEASSEFLHHFRTYSLDADKNLQALWGKLASEILVTQVCSSITFRATILILCVWPPYARYDAFIGVRAPLKIEVGDTVGL